MTTSEFEIEAHADEHMLETLSLHQCTGCGACCRWSGQVLLYPDDIRRIASRLFLSAEDFLVRQCVIVRWKWEKCEQFRIALARKTVREECVFLNGTLCSIHDFKPMMCKAGPAAWPWISNPNYFWYYVRNSPSFSHPIGTMSRGDANTWFLATRTACAVARNATSLQTLAELHQVSEETLRRLPLIDFEEREDLQMSALPAPEPQKPEPPVSLAHYPDRKSASSEPGPVVSAEQSPSSPVEHSEFGAARNEPASKP